MLTAVSTLFAFDDAVSGIAKIKLSGQLTQEQITSCKSDARARFRAHLIAWLDQERNVKVDTTDALTCLLFGNFVDSCIGRTQGMPELKGSYWTYAYSMPPDSVAAVIASYDDRIELLATHSWVRLTNAITVHNDEEIYYQSVSVIAHAAAYIGPSLRVPGDSAALLIDTARSVLRGFLDRLAVTSSDQLIAGKPGMPATDPPTITVTIGGRPFSGLGMTGFIPGGHDVWNGVTDHDGRITFENFIVPFAANGTMLYVAPNLGRVLDNQWHVGVKDFGIESSNDLNQSFFLKITRPVFSLTFDASDPDPADSLPREFLSGALVKKFLVDSCWLDSAADSGGADLAIGVKCRISSANSDELDAGEARLEGVVTVQAPRLSPPRFETDSIYFEKKYDRVPYETSNRRRSDALSRMSVPLGGFIWEANVKIRRALRAAIGRL
jgi:hypothetical protein